MKRRLGFRRVRGMGEVLLLAYLAVVLGVALMQVVMGWPAVRALASSPVLLLDGQWWRLMTSALVIQGPPVPQVIAIAVLGSLGIYFGGSWLFWRTAVTGHIFGTLTAYWWFAVVWLADHTQRHWLMAPDYGVSLVWSAALGAFAGWAWMGERAQMRRPERPLWVVAAVAVLLVVEAYSDPMARLQHGVAFAVGAAVIATADRSRRLARQRRPLVKAAARA